MCGPDKGSGVSSSHCSRNFNVSEAALLVDTSDASNAFNSMNRATAFANVMSLCPSLAKLLINCYRESSDLYIDGEVIQSQKGATQGDPLSMLQTPYNKYGMLMMELPWGQ